MKKLSIIIIVLVAILVCCKKTPEVNIKYVDVEREVLTIGSTTANIQCDYEYIATLKSAKLYYGRIEDNMNYVNMRVVQSVLYAEITGLESNTNYKYYYEFENGFNSMQSGVKTFTTEENPTTVVLPTVITADVTEITSESAVSGGEVISDGGGNVTSRGVCWSTSPNPTLSNSFTTDGTGIGSFVSNLTGLSDNTTYHVRAYATNEAGTAYGLDKEFTTLNGGGGGDAPTGAVNGLFTINENGDQVYFSQGNLQYQASTNTWRFAEHQWDYVGNDFFGTVYVNGVKCNNEFISSTYDGWIDLFGWGTSSWDNGNIYYMPFDYDSHWNGEIGRGYGPTDGTNYNYNLTDAYANADWGVYNSINNGGNMPGLWRSITDEEITYLLNLRDTPSGVRFAKAIVNGVDGVILLPDNWSTIVYLLDSPNRSDAPYITNEITIDIWAVLENNGAVFLPVAGHRINLSINVQLGLYWLSTCDNNTSRANLIHFSRTALYIVDVFRERGHSVRLVQDANK